MVFAVVAVALMALAAIAAIAVAERASAEGPQADLNPPTVTKELLDYSNGTAYWRVTVDGTVPIFDNDSNATPGGYTFDVSDATALTNMNWNGASCSSSGWNPQDGAWVSNCLKGSNATAEFFVYTDAPASCTPRAAVNLAVVTITDASSASNNYYTGPDVVIPVNASQLIQDDAVCPPTVTKEFVEYDPVSDYATWRVTVSTPTWEWYPQQNYGSYVYELWDSNATYLPEDGATPGVQCGPLTGIGPPTGWICLQESNVTQWFELITEHEQTCEDRVVQNSVEGIAYFDGETPFSLDLPYGNGPNDVWNLSASATGVIPGDPNLCPNTLTVIKLFDSNGNGQIDASDTPIPGWGIDLECSTYNNLNGTINESGITGGGGTAVFTLPYYTYVCAVTEATVTGVVPLGHQIVNIQGNESDLMPGTTANIYYGGTGSLEQTITFLNDPGDPPPSQPPSIDGSPPPGDTATPTSTSPPPPTSEVEQPTATPTEPDGSAVGADTPIAPDTGTGPGGSSGRGAGSLLFVMAGLVALSGAAGALSLATRRQ